MYDLSLRPLKKKKDENVTNGWDERAHMKFSNSYGSFYICIISFCISTSSEVEKKF